MNSATLAVDFSKGNYGELSLVECIGELGKKTRAVHKGNLQDAETLLTTQAFALDAIFMSLARRAQLNMGEYIDAADRYMRLALKAQGQYRATLETLANIKNPPVAVARQANISNGPQQVNNTEGDFESSTRARETQNLCKTNYWSTGAMKQSGGSLERRKQQSEAIRRWQPWAKSTDRAALTAKPVPFVMPTRAAGGEKRGNCSSC